MSSIFFHNTVKLAFTRLTYRPHKGSRSTCCETILRYLNERLSPKRGLLSLQSLRAIRANIDFPPIGKQTASKVKVGLAIPDFAKGRFFDIPHGVFGVFVEAARHDVAIPGHDAGMPHSPAFVLKFTFNGKVTIFHELVPAKRLIGRD